MRKGGGKISIYVIDKRRNVRVSEYKNLDYTPNIFDQVKLIHMSKKPIEHLTQAEKSEMRDMFAKYYKLIQK